MSASEGFRYVELQPVQDGDAWDPEALSKAIRAASLPPGGIPVRFADAKPVLQRHYGWRDPRGLLAYSKGSPYKDLAIVFDAGDSSSPINVAASKAFRCYGLDGKQGGSIDWGDVRGPCIIRREDVPSMTSFATGKMERMNFTYHPLITTQELVDTVLFFKTRDAHKVAIKRDSTRSLLDVPRDHPMFALLSRGQYVSTAGTRPLDKVMGKDARQCATCGKPNTIACSLKYCSMCKSAWYCGRDCQKKDFPRHKTECASLAQEQQQQTAKAAGAAGAAGKTAA
ncbi:hypothetical protein HYH02_015070 [Chlamydomonas schloesseri]|uniref:MYND-type domain-containing protein n=1 Tax=Chlamydomonas schloesseri TaxID=2026947 RepID=A0A835VTV3_9CHLO|nr:hypothetical protein HYH02_015070 [Chlamydomonas schloesseri]|eukprot:KAG2425126.1 hypothetical protein HYH02_015070 [Chlamydomonas schloesseri]